MDDAPLFLGRAPLACSRVPREASVTADLAREPIVDPAREPTVIVAAAVEVPTALRDLRTPEASAFAIRIVDLRGRPAPLRLADLRANDAPTNKCGRDHDRAPDLSHAEAA